MASLFRRVGVKYAESRQLWARGRGGATTRVGRNAEGDCVADTGSALETHIRRRAACKALSAFGKMRGVPACHSWNAPRLSVSSRWQGASMYCDAACRVSFLVLLLGVEPSSSGYKPDALPLCDRSLCQYPITDSMATRHFLLSSASLRRCSWLRSTSSIVGDWQAGSSIDRPVSQGIQLPHRLESIRRVGLRRCTKVVVTPVGAAPFVLDCTHCSPCVSASGNVVVRCWFPSEGRVGRRREKGGDAA